MNLLQLQPLDELSLGLADLSMFPYFDMAHYIVSVMALRDQPGELRDAATSARRQERLSAALFSRTNIHFGPF